MLIIRLSIYIAAESINITDDHVSVIEVSVYSETTLIIVIMVRVVQASIGVVVKMRWALFDKNRISSAFKYTFILINSMPVIIIGIEAVLSDIDITLIIDP